MLWINGLLRIHIYIYIHTCMYIYQRHSKDCYWNESEWSEGVFIPPLVVLYIYLYMLYYLLLCVSGWRWWLYCKMWLMFNLHLGKITLLEYWSGKEPVWCLNHGSNQGAMPSTSMVSGIGYLKKSFGGLKLLSRYEQWEVTPQQPGVRGIRLVEWIRAID